ncbi:MAG: kinase/pyrophosphorylase [candidate division KSB1 bacterium]|nr:kinase/pyrophosphorylase [candidate division KSB1 bacterium]
MERERAGSSCTIYIVSDATGATAEAVVRAALTQFDNSEVTLRRISNVRSPEQVRQVIEEASRSGNGIIVHTLVSPELREELLAASRQRNVAAIDLMGPLLTRLENLLKISPLAKPGLFRHLDEDYYRRMEAIDFAVNHDDGRNPRDLTRADVVLVGVSRTSKTPICVFLAYRGWFAANVPLTPEIPPPPELLQVERSRVIGLVISAARLQSIRKARLERMGYGLQPNYIDLRRIEQELAFSRSLCREHGWAIVDVTGKSIEEAASEITSLVGRRAA